jgi:hypothetical protein
MPSGGYLPSPSRGRAASSVQTADGPAFRARILATCGQRLCYVILTGSSSSMRFPNGSWTYARS